MKLSIIIPCLNEEKYIEKCISSVLENDFPKKDYEIIIVDGGSTDNTLTILDKLKELSSVPIKVLHNSKKIPPTAMNIGIKEAKGNLIMRLDTHASYPSNYISSLITWKEKLDADNIGAVAITEVLNISKKSIAIKKVLANKFGVGDGLFRIGVEDVVEVDTVPFGCYSKDLLIELGGYDERLTRNQDIELNKRLVSSGKRIFLIPYTHCIYYARETWSALAKNNYNNGKWNMLTVYLTKDFRSLSLRHFIPLLFVLSLILPLIGMLIHPLIGLLALTSFITYSIALMYITFKMDKKQTDFLHIFLTFIVLHFSYGFGSIIGGVQLHKIAQ